jgi:hypothetical protein
LCFFTRSRGRKVGVEEEVVVVVVVLVGDGLMGSLVGRVGR